MRPSIPSAFRFQGTLTVDEVGERNNMQVFETDYEPETITTRSTCSLLVRPCLCDLLIHVSDYVSLPGTLNPAMVQAL